MQIKRGLLIIFLVNLATQALASPLRVASINLCADQWLLAFDLDAISYRVSPLSLDTRSSLIASQISEEQALKPQLADLIAFKPDLVLVGPYTDSYLRFGLEKQGVQLFELPLIFDIDEMQSTYIALGKLLNQPEIGQKKADDLGKSLEKKEQLTQTKHVLFLAPGGFTQGKNTHYDFIIKQLGWLNVAEESGIVGAGYLSIEQIILTNPDLIIIEGDTNGFSQAQQFFRASRFKKLESFKENNTDAKRIACLSGTTDNGCDQLSQAQ